MSIRWRRFLFLLAFLFTATGYCQTNYDPARQYSIEELQSDFQFLRNKLEKRHPNLYLYTSKDEFNLFFDSLYNSIKTPLTETGFYNLITLLNTKIRDGHTMFLPGEEATNYYNRNALFFPFYIFIDSGKLYVNMNCSADTLIKAGAEILSVNGINTKDLLDQLLLRQIHDGNNKTYPTWILTNYFKSYVGFSFGHPATFNITYKTNAGIEQAVTINALPNDSIKYYKQFRYSSRIPVTAEKQGIVLEINDQAASAIVTIKSFDKQLLRSVYKQEFKTEIERIFAQIQSKQVSNLILDLRNNQGGDFEAGRFLLAKLIQQPVQYLLNSSEQRTISLAENNYTGKLFVLINGGSFSNSGIVSSYLELVGRATFIGEEAAGNKYIISGDARDFILPNTRIMAEISAKSYVIRNTANDGHGVIPSYYITTDIDDVLSGKDPVIEFTKTLLK